MRSPARLLVLLYLIPVAHRLGAQEWQPGRELDLIVRATEARLRRDADTVLAGWQALARGMVRFTAGVDHGNGPIERVIRADELRLEVYGEAPNRSKQVITAWRDTTFQPTSIVYHRDHLGIIANDFGPVIRLGEGEEVRDVPHPLSAAGLDWYQFRPRDTVVVSAATGTVRVVVLDVRPRDPEGPGIAGLMLVDSDRAALVRLSFTFTAASYRDPTVSGITVRLENALHESQHWLPWRQSIAIRRATPLLVLPLATVIRADWTIDDYQLGLRHSPERFRGMSIDGPRRPQADSGWTEPWPSPPDALNTASVAELEGVTALAAASVRSDLLEGLPQFRLFANGGLSRLLQVNRVQGITPGMGVRWRAPVGVTLDLAGAIGTADGRVTGSGSVSWFAGDLRMEVTRAREIRDMHEWQRRSGVANSIATLVDGSDAGDWYLSDRLELAMAGSPARWMTVTGSIRRERTSELRSAFTAINGGLLANPALGNGSEVVSRASLSLAQPDGRGWQLSLEKGGAGREREWLRFAIQMAGALPIGLEWRAWGGIGSRSLPAHRGFVMGGAGSLPGTVPRAVGGRQLAVLELSHPLGVALPAPIGPRLAGNALNSRVIPFVALGMAREPFEGLPWQATGDLVPVLGARLDLWGPLLRVELGWAPRTGGISLMLDAHPDWWPLL